MPVPPGLLIESETDAFADLDVRDLTTFRRFVAMCAGRTGNLLNLSGLANDCGITHNTARAWISVLEAGYIVFRLPPHHRNFDKRLIKTPKLYFWDTGLAAWLLGIRSEAALQVHAMRGALFESWAISELSKAFTNRGEIPPLSFWRDRAGHEIDLVVEVSGRLVPIEFKSGQTVTRDQLRGLTWFQHLAGAAAVNPVLVSGAEHSGERRDVKVIGWRDVPTLAQTLGA